MYKEELICRHQNQDGPVWMPYEEEGGGKKKKKKSMCTVDYFENDPRNFLKGKYEQ